MALQKRYDPNEAEPRLQAFWDQAGVYRFDRASGGPVYAIDTPPPTVSGQLHLGHAYSYTQTDFIARFRRMRGENVFYPLGFDDNGLPTERLVERQLGVRAAEIGRRAFNELCLQAGATAAQEYRALWQRLGLSVDWRHTYRTSDTRSRRISQWSFIDLYRKGLVYRQKAPAIWCPECGTAIAQADLNDLERESEFFTLPFQLAGGEQLLVATTRPELLPACVAVFVHPGDGRYRGLAGRGARVPLFDQEVPILEDPGADPGKGTGAVMCCTFGDAADKEWWYTYRLPLVESIARDGTLTAAAGDFAGLPVLQARRRIVEALDGAGLLLRRQPALQTVRVHERCDTPVEYIVTWQWFIRVLDHKNAFLETAQQVNWYPPHMQARFRSWVENLAWDWCISRQRSFGVPFPLWYCQECGEVLLAEEHELPVDPRERQPGRPCQCGSTHFIPEQDVLDTWATSSLSPQICAGWQDDPDLYRQVFPLSLRPQAHEIIRTWAFYTIVKSLYHFDAVPWKDVAIAGWGIAGEGMGKISKSRGGGPLSPQEMVARYSADALRYWAASTGPGKDAVISEEKIAMGARLATKLWNVARFSQSFLEGYSPPPAGSPPSGLTTADRWMLSRLQGLVRRATASLAGYDYAAAKSEIENFFWRDLADNYLEMCKQRLYDADGPLRDGACFTLYRLLHTLVHLLAPFLPFVTEEIYQGLFAGGAADQAGSLHRSHWPEVDPHWEDGQAERAGEALVAIATGVRRFKSERNLALGTPLARLQLITSDHELAAQLSSAIPDLRSITRAREITLAADPDPDLETICAEGPVRVAVLLQDGDVYV